jgi:hypothetical protein
MVNDWLTSTEVNAGRQFIDTGLEARDEFRLPQLVASTIIGIIAGLLGGTAQPYHGYTHSLGNSQKLTPVRGAAFAKLAEDKLQKGETHAHSAYLLSIITRTKAS